MTSIHFRNAENEKPLLQYNTPSDETESEAMGYRERYG